MTDRPGEPKRGGRPRKFPGPSRVVTLTLPRTTIDQLSDIHEDRATAIVKAAEFAGFSGWADRHDVLAFVLTTVAAVTVALTLSWRPVRKPLERVVTPVT